MITCDCSTPGYCPHFKRQLVGRLWEIIKGINTDEATRQKYIEMFTRQANLSGDSQPATRPVGTAKPCNCNK